MKLWEVYPNIWKTESAFLSWVRGGIRRSLWNRHPLKLEFIKQNRIKIPNPNPKGKVTEVWGATCALTGVTLPLKDMEVDHKTGNHSLKTINDIQSFVSGIVLITIDDLQFVSKEAHKIKSYAEKQGISFEQAMVEKQAITLTKKPVKEIKEWLEGRGVVPSTKASERRLQIVEVLLAEMEDN